jgi:hypothetical protein
MKVIRYTICILIALFCLGVVACRNQGPVKEYPTKNLYIEAERNDKQPFYSIKDVPGQREFDEGYLSFFAGMMASDNPYIVRGVKTGNLVNLTKEREYWLLGWLHAANEVNPHKVNSSEFKKWMRDQFSVNYNVTVEALPKDLP